MPRPHDTDRYDLSAAEKRDLIKLIEQGKPLPEKYRFFLFADKSEVELVWNGKTREVCTAILPFQTLEHIDEPRKETGKVGRVSPLRAGLVQSGSGAHGVTLPTQSEMLAQPNGAPAGKPTTSGEADTMTLVPVTVG